MFKTSPAIRIVCISVLNNHTRRLSNAHYVLLLQYPYELALVGAIVWCLLVSCSRIYLGMHSVLVSYVFNLVVSLMNHLAWWFQSSCLFR